MRFTLRHFSFRVWPVLVLIALTLVAVVLMSDAVQNSQRFGSHYFWLLIFNAAVLLLLAVLVVANVIEMIRRGLRRDPGARLTLRLAGVFVLLSFIPVFVVFAFSLRFLENGINSWFNVRIERALDDALVLARSSLQDRVNDLLRQTEEGAQSLSGVDPLRLPQKLGSLRRRLKASELTLFGRNQAILATSGGGLSMLVPSLPPPSALREYARTHHYAALEPSSGQHLLIRILVPVPPPADSVKVTGGSEMLQAIFGIDARNSALAANVQDAYNRYRELVFLRVPLMQSFTLTLSMVLLLSVLSALWASFVLARRVLRPVRQLIDAIRRVAEGDLGTKLDSRRRDEVGLLARSFNEMTRRLANAREETERARRQLERQRGYLQTVLEHLSPGVLTLDRNAVLRTANPSADAILEQSLDPFFGRRLSDVGEHAGLLHQLYRAVEPHLAANEETWEIELELFGETGVKMLICKGARLPESSGGGHVLLIDDVTALILAQRNAAWGEVARRLAHEIRNPLTPIQLSAERLRRKLLPQLADEDGRILSRATDTIVAQVEAMQQLVTAFSDYARAPAMQPQEVDFNALVESVVELYRAQAGITLQFQPDQQVGPMVVDPNRMRQLLNNLIKNAIEACAAQPQPRVEVATRVVVAENGEVSYVELSVSDNGPGISAEWFPRLFQPYVSHKQGGTGLGLAVVKKIVEEHHGRVFAENGDTEGARFVVLLPRHGLAPERNEKQGES